MWEVKDGNDMLEEYRYDFSTHVYINDDSDIIDIRDDIF